MTTNVKCYDSMILICYELMTIGPNLQPILIGLLLTALVVVGQLKILKKQTQMMS